MADDKLIGDGMKGDDFDKLIAAWLDGRLSAEDSQTLQTELRESASARSKFRKYAELDARLHELADTSDMLRSAERIAGAVHLAPEDADSADPTEVQNTVTLPPRTSGSVRTSSMGKSPFSRLATWYTALAVGMLLVVALFSYLDSAKRGTEINRQVAIAETSERVEPANVEQIRKPPAPVATLASAERALWGGSQIEVGQAMYEGESVSLLEGEARISVGFGAEIVADAPFSMTFLASDRIKLHQGKVAVDVAPWAKGFTVVTEEMDIVDLGTTFTVATSPGIMSETTVLKGVVRVRPTKVQNEQPRGLLVTEGRQVSIDDQGLLTNMLREESLQLLDALDFGGTGPYRPVDLNNTGLALSVGDEDQHWRVVAGPAADFSGPQYATVCLPERGYLPNSPNSSQWISIADWKSAAPNSVYTFRTEFDLKGYDLSTIQLFGRFLADNGIEAVRVNGKSVHVQSWVDNVKYQQFADPQFRFVNVTQGLVNGRNLIEVDVRNGMMRTGKLKNPPLKAIPNPMALRVEWYAFGRQYEFANNGDNAKLFSQLQQQISPRLALSYRGPEI